MYWTLIFLLSYSFACTPLDSERFEKCKPLGDSSQYVYPDIFSKYGLRDLKIQLQQTHQALSYDCLWKAMAESESSPTNNQEIQLFYRRTWIKVSQRDCGQNDPNSWNREHLWAKSRGFPKKSSLAYRDLHHIRASDRSINTWRSNRYFIEFTESEELLLKRNSECLEGCFKDQHYFEPPEEIKGDIARSLLYMAFRYDGDIQDKTPDLIISSKYPDPKSKIGEWGGLCTLIQWHQEDPPQETEFYRNNIVQIWQGNRNPFIDHPEWVQVIFAEQCSER